MIIISKDIVIRDKHVRAIGSLDSINDIANGSIEDRFDVFSGMTTSKETTKALAKITCNKSRHNVKFTIQLMPLNSYRQLYSQRRDIRQTYMAASYKYSIEIILT